MLYNIKRKASQHKSTMRTGALWVGNGPRLARLSRQHHQGRTQFCHFRRSSKMLSHPLLQEGLPKTTHIMPESGMYVHPLCPSVAGVKCTDSYGEFRWWIWSDPEALLLASTDRTANARSHLYAHKGIEKKALRNNSKSTSGIPRY